MASRHLLITGIADVGTSFSPIPRQAWHGYGVTNAYRVEVKLGADGHASAPPAGSPPLRRRPVLVGALRDLDVVLYFVFVFY
jgi:hypothetical protein